MIIWNPGNTASLQLSKGNGAVDARVGFLPLSLSGAWLPAAASRAARTSTPAIPGRPYQFCVEFTSCTLGYNITMTT